MTTSERWPFPDPPNLAVFTLKRILKEGKPVLIVIHDEEDGGWQFLDGGEMTVSEDALLVGLSSLLKRDPTLAELADLPVGWRAFRAAVGHPWKRVEADP